jgi:oxalate---CoA ligase
MSGIATAEIRTDTIAALLDAGRAQDVALAAPARAPLTYAALREQVRRTAAALNALGVGRNDTVAIVLPNGPELACAFLSIASVATAAPLNPSYRRADFEFYLSDLGAKALVVAGASDSPALAVAREQRIPVLRVAHDAAQPAGTFTLAGAAAGAAKRDGFAVPADTALVLHTSGTTARPKMVPLTQANLAASARHIGETLRLSRADRCLNVMPLFHIHGLIAGILSSMAAGGSAFCAPCLNALEFFRWLEEAQPSWYTAVPTMHQAILAQAGQHRRIIERVRLRFIRSSSAALPVAVMRRLEAAFQAPVIESYGMTEAAHQMASNPLPPGARKAGSVGRAAGPEVAIMAPDGRLLATGEVGEVVIRGPNVTAGYANNPEANAQAFTGGWFRTGDQGMLDEDGYLSLTGRLKEIINRGGEKISPKEIDDVLMEHPGVAGAAAFPLPHPTLGEEIAAAVVPAPGTVLSEPELLRFLSERLPSFKVPRRLLLVDAIPKGATGKIQRRELAAALGVSAGIVGARAVAASNERPPTPLEAKLKSLWEKTLGVSSVGLHDNFFLLGGDSLQAVQLVASVEQALGHALAQAALIECGTIAEMAARIEHGAPAGCIVPFRTTGTRPPFFCVHDVSGQVINMRHLARYLGEEQPFYGIQAVGVDGKRPPFSRIEDMAAHYIAELRKYQPAGPYFLGGFSMGGWVAFEMTRQLCAAGERVALLALIDAYFGHERRRATIPEWLRRRWREFLDLPSPDRLGFLRQRLARAPYTAWVTLRVAWTRLKRPQRTAAGASAPAHGADAANQRAVDAYRLRPLHCDAVLLKTRLAGWDHPVVHDGWKDVIAGRLEMRTIAGQHAEVINEPFVRTLAAELSVCLEARQGHGTGATAP